MNTKTKIKNFAIILASGSGARFQSDVCPKHLNMIKGVPTVIWTLHSAIQSRLFEFIVVVTRDIDLDKTNKIVSKYFHVNDLNLFSTIGGEDRMQSFFNGLSGIENKIKISNLDLITLIDSNRPFCSVKQLIDLNDLAIKFGCSCPARPLVNGVAKIIDSKITEVPPKEAFVEFVTPEIIQYDLLMASVKKTSEVAFKSLVEFAINESVNPVYSQSSELNSKLTYPEDLLFLEGLVNKYNIEMPKEIKVE